MRVRRHAVARRIGSERGVSMIEAIISLGVMAIGLLGLAHIQVIAVRSNQIARNLSLASSLAHDLVENISRWDYNDPRLTALGTVNAFSATLITKRLDPGREETITDSNVQPQFGEKQQDSNTANPNSLGTHEGASADVDRDGKLDFFRYWTVFNYDSDGDGKAEGKLVLVVVRWKEPGYGFRNITTHTFKFNEAIFSLL